MDVKQGIHEIETAEWVLDSSNTLNLWVHDSQGLKVHCHISLRPKYCDRGHIKLLIDGPIGLDSADSFPRYFFSFAEADHHTRTFLKWRLWKHRTYTHGWPQA